MEICVLLFARLCDTVFVELKFAKVCQMLHLGAQEETSWHFRPVSTAFDAILYFLPDIEINLNSALYWFYTAVSKNSQSSWIP